MQVYHAMMPKLSSYKYFICIAIYGWVLNGSVAMAQRVNYTSAEVEWIEQNYDSLVVALEPRFPPFEFINESGDFDGLSVEYLRRIEQQTGLRFKYAHYPTWAAIIAATKKGDVDIWGLSAISEQRKEYMLFSEELVSFQAVILANIDVSERYSLKDLAGKKVGIVNNYIWHDIIKVQYPEITLVTFDNQVAMLQALSMHELDVVIMSATVASYYIEFLGITNLRIAGNTALKKGLALAVQKENAPFLPIMNKVIASIPEEVHDQMHKKWIHLEGITPRQKARIWRYAFVGIAIVILLAIVTWVWISQLRRLVNYRTKELKAERNALAISKAQYKKLFDGAFSAILLFDANKILHYNSFALELFGLEAHKLKHRSFLSLSAPNGAEEKQVKHFNRLLNTLRTENGKIVPWQFLNSKGEAIETQMSVSRIVTHKGQEVFQAIILDLTAERKRQRRIENLAARLALATKVAGIGIWELSLSDRCLRWEPSMFAIYEVNALPKNSSLETWAEFIHPDDRRRASVTVENVIRKRGTLDAVFRIITGKGHDRYIKAYGKVIDDKETGSSKMLGTNWDITNLVKQQQELLEQKEEYQALSEAFEEKNTELENSLEELNSLNQELNQAKLRAEESDQLKSAFLANISHEIRTPLNGITGFLEIIERGDLNEEKRLQYGQVIKESGERLLMTLTDLVDASKLETGQLNFQTTQCNLKKMLQVLVQGFENSRMLHVPLYKHFEKREPLEISCDPHKLIKVIQKLLDNALKYTREGFVVVDYQIEQEEVCLWVKDTGLGISEQMRQVVFQLFRQADMTINRRFEGVGIGLALAKAFVEGMNGRMKLESELGKGSIFYIYLPLATVEKKITYR